MVHTHTHACPNTNTQTQSRKQSYGITKVTRIMVKGSLMPLVLGNWRVFRDSLAKTSIILSAVPLSRLFCSYPLSMWIQWLFLVASAYSLGQWGDQAALGMNIWINSSREEIVWQWVLTEEQSSQQSFSYFIHEHQALGICFDAKKLHQVEDVTTVKYPARK